MKYNIYLFFTVCIASFFMACGSGQDQASDTTEVDLKTRVQSDPLYQQHQEAYVAYLTFIRNNPEVISKSNELAEKVQNEIQGADDEAIRAAWEKAGFPLGGEQAVLMRKFADLTLQIREKYPELNEIDQNEYNEIMLKDGQGKVNAQ